MSSIILELCGACLQASSVFPGEGFQLGCLNNPARFSLSVSPVSICASVFNISNRDRSVQTVRPVRIPSPTRSLEP